MRRLLLFVTVLAVSGLGAFVPSAATPSPDFTVGGDGVGTYPAFDPQVLRYAVTTTAATAGSIVVTVPAGSTVDGVPADGAVPVNGLAEGDEVAVGVNGTSYALVYLPPDFPALTVTTPRSLQAQLAPGYVGLGLTTFGAGPSFDAIIDRNGVPVWLHRGATSDLKRQPNGDLTVFRPTSAGAPFTGTDLVTLTEQFAESGRQHVQAPFTDTDNHDAEKLPDGSTILVGFEPRGDVGTGYLDATIQKLDPQGQVVFTWNSKDHMDPLVETMNPLLWPPLSTEQRIDYAHVNSVQEIEDGTHDLLVSFRHLSAVYRIATVAHDGYAAGDVVWRLGGRHSDFSFVGDPDNGPCAQHSANLLLDQADGHDHVLVFDNGSGALGQSAAGCVDPADPLGPGIERRHTRIAEWSLDTSAHTATLVWSYEPTIYDPDPRAPFAFFAGSARRLGNGDTLVGWADERAMLATEVDAAQNLLWQVETPPTDTPHSTRYATYRASLIPYTDAIPPTVAADVADGAIFPDDGVPAPHWSCTDRGGANLASCGTTGLVDGHLSTTPGLHTLVVTATDGAGHTTSLTRTYRIVHGYLPDAVVRKHGTTRWKGGDLYGSTTGQSVHQRVPRGRAATSYWRVQNDGQHADGFALTGTRGTKAWRVRYFAGSTDVTRAVVAGTYRTPVMAPGAHVSLRIKVTPTRRARHGAGLTVTASATSLAQPAAADHVAIRVTARR